MKSSKKPLSLSLLLASLLATSIVGCNSGGATNNSAPKSNVQNASQTSENQNVGIEMKDCKAFYKITNNTSEDIVINVPDADNIDCKVDFGNNNSQKDAYNCGAHDGAKAGHPEFDLNGYKLKKGETLHLHTIITGYGLGEYDASLAVDLNNKAGWAISSSKTPYDGKYNGVTHFVLSDQTWSHSQRLFVADATKYDIHHTLSEVDPAYSEIYGGAKEHDIDIRDKPVTAINEIHVGARLEPGSRFVSGNGLYELDVGKYGFNVYVGKGANNNSYTRMIDENIFDNQFDDENSFIAFQGDSNIVAYSTHGGSHSFWASGTMSKSVDTLAMANDGDLVAYSGTTKVWSSGTGGGYIPPVFFRDKTSTPDNQLMFSAVLSPGKVSRVVSNNGLYQLELQTDGNLVIRNFSGHAIWATNTDAPVHGGGFVPVLVNEDGVLKLYDADINLVWTTHTGSGDGTFKLGDDGVLYVHKGSEIMWKSTDTPSKVCSENTANPTCPSFLVANSTIVSPNGKYTLVLGSDGNLVEKVTDTNKTVWASGADASVIGKGLKLSVNGNISVDAYDKETHAKIKTVWSQLDKIAAIDRLELHDDGNLVAYSGVMDMWQNGIHIRN